MKIERNAISPQWEAFLHALAVKISEPTPLQLSVRCWTRTSLTKAFQQIIKTLNLPSSFASTTEILAHLINIGWAYPVKVDVLSEKVPPSKDFFLLDIGAAHNVNVDPLELLQTYKPDGVICYFSALAYHALTTQFATHHHIAQVYKPVPAMQWSNESVRSDQEPEKSRKMSLGEKVFVYEGIPCYLIKRSTSRLVGVQTRVLGPRTNLRITTLEQTLLDTLHKPTYCGGISVVIEAWEEGIGRLDEDLLGKYLIEIGTPLALRRVGAIFDLLDFKTGVKLESILETGLDSAYTDIPLLPGLEFNGLNPKWKVMTL